MVKKPKVIRLFANASFEETAIELLQKYEPGPVYIVSTETVDGPGVYLCTEPFTLEEAEEQNLLVPEEALDFSDEEEGVANPSYEEEEDD